MSELTKYDFFTIYGLNEYTPDNPTYGGFLPVKIKTTKLYSDETNSDADAAKPDIEFNLPMAIGEISDGVSVSYSRRGDNTVGGQVAQAASEWVAGLKIFDNSSITENISQILLAKYDPGSLTKKLEFDFILPLTNTSSYSANMIQNVRNAMGALQGMVYPRSFGFCYAPMVSVSIGGLYKNFKGFISDVSFRASAELINIGGEMFPVTITGSVKFINVFMYTWNEQFQNVIGSFNLKENPSLLFGFDSSSTAEVFGSGLSYGSAISNSILSEEIKKINTDAKLNSIINNNMTSGLSEKTKENLRLAALDNTDLFNMTGETDLFNISAYTENTNISNIISDPSISFAQFSEIGEVLQHNNTIINDTLHSGTLFNVNLDSLSSIATTFKNITDITNRNLYSVDNYLRTMQTVLNTNALDDIRSVFRTAKSTVRDISRLSSSINNIANIGNILIGNTNRNLDMNNVSRYYSNFSNFNNNSTITNNNVMENILASTLAVNNMSKLINNSSKIISLSSTASNPVTALNALGSINVLTNLATGLNDFKTSFKNMNEQAASLIDENKITSAEYYAIKSLYNESKNMNFDYIINANSAIENKLNIITDKLS